MIGRTPLLYAAKGRYEKVVITLLTNKHVDSDSKHHYGATLSIAVRNRRTEIMKLLWGAKRIDSQDFFGCTPPWWASKTGSADIVQLLLHFAKIIPVSAYESGPPTEISITSNDGESSWCDIFTLSIPEDHSYYRCEACCREDFDICLKYYKIRRCLEDNHNLIQRTDKDEPKYHAVCFSTSDRLLEASYKLCSV
jgi:hypothetical protein